MFFVGTILSAIGYTMVYAAVKGDAYTVGGVPVWRRPWLPLVDIFSGRALSGGAGPKEDSTVAPGAQLAAAYSAAAGAAQSAGQQTVPTPAATSAGASALGPSSAPGPSLAPLPTGPSSSPVTQAVLD